MDIKNITIIDSQLIEYNLLIIEIFKLIEINVSSVDELENLILDRSIFLEPSLYNNLQKYIPLFKKYLKSSSKTCLHANSQTKQKFPSLNIYRQVLKKINFNLAPLVISKGYNKYTGKKIYQRYFEIKKNSNDLNFL